MKILAVLLLSAAVANAATVRYAATNVFGVGDTNIVRIIPVGSPIQANGGFITRGPGFRMTPDSNGIATTNLQQGNYLITNSVLGQGILFAVPNDSSTNVYNIGDLAISGFNTYNYTPGVRVLTAGDGIEIEDLGNGQKKISATASSGAPFVAKTGDTMTGPLTNNFGYHGDGGGLTNLQVNAENLTGTIPDARMPSTIARRTNDTLVSPVIAGGTNNSVANTEERIFNVRAFGAAADARVVTRASITAGSTTLTSPNGNWTLADIGKGISVYGAGSNGWNLTTTIAGVNSATSITLSDAAATSVSQYSAVYGTDDTAALQAAFNALTNEPVRSLTLVFPGMCYVSGPLVGTNNAQLSVPPYSMVPQVRPTLKLKGAWRTRSSINARSLHKDIAAGGCGIWSVLPRGSNGGINNDHGAVIAGQNPYNGYTVTAGVGHPVTTHFNNVSLFLEDMQIYTAWNADIVALDARGFSGFHMVRSDIVAGYHNPVLFPKNADNNPDYTGTNGFAVRLPSFFNDNDVYLQSCKISGFRTAIDTAENTVANDLDIFGAETAITCLNGSAGITQWRGLSIQECSNVFVSVDISWPVEADGVMINNTELDWKDDIHAIWDPAHAIYGTITLQQHRGPYAKSVIPGDWDRNKLLVKQILVDGSTIQSGRFAIVDGRQQTGLLLGADFAQDRSITANTRKHISIGVPAYSSDGSPWADPPANVLSFDTMPSDTHVNIGGDANDAYPGATIIRFLTATNNTTDKPKVRWVMTGNGLYGSGVLTATNTPASAAADQIVMGRTDDFTRASLRIFTIPSGPSWRIQKEKDSAVGQYAGALVFQLNGQDKLWLGTNGLLNVPGGFHSGLDINNPGAAKLPYGATASHIVLTNGTEGTDVILTNFAAGTLQVRTNLNVLGTATAVDVTATTVTADEVYAGNLLSAEDVSCGTLGVDSAVVSSNLIVGRNLDVTNGNVTVSGNVTGGSFNGAHSGDGGGLTNLNASALGTGTIPDARLSANVTLLGPTIDVGGAEITGTLKAGSFPALTGDVTTSAGSLATTIANDAVSNAKLANMAQGRIKGRVSSGTGDPEDLTAEQVKEFLDLKISDFANIVGGRGVVVQQTDSRTLALSTIPDLDDVDLVAWYSFAENTGTNFLDYSTNRFLMRPTVFNQGTPTWTNNGVIGGGLVCGPDGEALIQTVAHAWGFSQLTCSAWFQKWTNINGIIATKSSGGTNGEFFLSSPSATTVQFTVILESGSRFEQTVNVPDLRDGLWHHLVGTYDGQVQRIWFDGQCLSEVSRPGKVKGFGIPFGIGGADHHGLVDEVRVYSRAFTTNEVVRLFYNERPPQQFQPASGILSNLASDGILPFIEPGTGVTFNTNGNVLTINSTGGGGTGSVTSVGLQMPAQFSVSNTPITGSGTLGVSWQNQSANRVLAGPTSGGLGQPTFRALVEADIPQLSYVAKTGDTMTGLLTAAAGIQTAGITSSAPARIERDLSIGGLGNVRLEGNAEIYANQLRPQEGDAHALSLNARQAYDSGGTYTIDWDNAQLRKSPAGVTLDWGQRRGYGTWTFGGLNGPLDAGNLTGMIWDGRIPGSIVRTNENDAVSFLNDGNLLRGVFTPIAGTNGVVTLRRANGTFTNFFANPQQLAYPGPGPADMARGAALLAALNAAGSGDVVHLGPGVFDLAGATNATLGTNVSLIGQGRGQTIIVNVTETNCALNLTRSNTISSVTLSNSTASGNYVGVRNITSDYGRMVFDDVAIYGYVDGMALVGTGSVEMRHSYVYGSLDSLSFTGPSFTIALYDSVFECVGSGKSLSIVAPNSTAIIKDCVFKKSGGGPSAFYFGVQSTSRASLFNCTWEVDDGSLHVQNVGGTLTLDAACNFDAEKVSGPFVRAKSYGHSPSEGFLQLMRDGVLDAENLTGSISLSALNEWPFVPLFAGGSGGDFGSDTFGRAAALWSATANATWTSYVPAEMWSATGKSNVVLRAYVSTGTNGTYNFNVGVSWWTATNAGFAEKTVPITVDDTKQVTLVTATNTIPVPPEQVLGVRAQIYTSNPGSVVGLVGGTVIAQ